MKNIKNIKNIKNVVSLLVAMVMVFAIAMTVSAAGADLTDHTYKAYQIFSGTQTENASDVYLYEIEFGSGVNGPDFLAALKDSEYFDATFDECLDAFDVAEILGTFGEDSENAREFAKIAYANKKGTGTSVVSGTTELEAGYYLVVDETKFAEGATNTVKNLALLQLTKKDTFFIKNKTSVPTVEKKVQDINDTTDKEVGELQDSADYDIGDSVPFTLTGTLPDNYADYETYTYIFHDTLCEGLTYNNDVKVYVVVDGSETPVASNKYTPTHESGKLTVSFENLKTVTTDKDAKIVVRYTATLNENAKLGYVGNENVVSLEYSNNPNNSGKGNGETGNTPEDKVIVFTYKLLVKKTDGENNALAGAGFTLYKKNAAGEWGQVKKITAGTDTEFSFTGLDDGEYKLVETEVPEGYNKADDIEFKITATHEIEAVNPELESLETNNEAITVEMTENDNYYTGVLNTTVINNKGTVLPETGGIGTTIFYVVGAILVLGAAVVMITRKRMSK